MNREDLLAKTVALFLRVYPSRQQYRLPDAEEVGEVTKSLAEVLGNRGCVVLGYDVPDQSRANAVVLINGNVVESVELVDIPNDEDSRP
ncbi:MAG TPA: hypothetical protein VGI55_11715 [Solirubrobacteraceae bacterium]